MAARMQARGSEPQESESEAADDANTTRGSPPREKIPDNQTNQDEIEEEDEEDVITTRPRKLKPRVERSSTPEARPHQAASSPGPVISPQKDAPNSPGLFVSPSKPRSPSADQSDDGLPSPTGVSKKPAFQALVARKRQERLAREAEEARKKAARRAAAGHDDDDIMADDEDDNITDDDGGRKLTQEAGASRPPRKASKKALEEMNRETQRLTRSLQLAHEAKVKKKLSKSALFERFNFRPGGATASAEEPAPAASSSRAPTPASIQQSDAEMKDAETPPSSPPVAGEDGISKDVPPPATENKDDEDHFPALDGLLVQEAAARKLDKGKGKATAADLEEPPVVELPRKRNIRVKLPPLQAHNASVSLDADDEDDLQILPSRKSKLDAIFDRIPTNLPQQAHSMQILRRLAHIDDPEKKPAPPSRAGNKLKKQQQEPAITAGELHANLLQRARHQAKLERDRHLEMLRAKGVHVQTAEEREKEMQDVEDMVAKARREAEELMDKERGDAKAERKKRRAAGEEDPLGFDDESDDEDYEEEVVEEKEVELSGSEEEGDEEVEEDDEEEGEGPIDDAAEVVEASETEEVEEQAGNQDSGDEELPGSMQVRRRGRKHVTIVTDDEDDAEPLVKATPRPKAHFFKSPSVRNAESPSVPTSVLRSATKTFIPGLPVAGPAGLGLTQIFAGTMDDSQMGPTQTSPTQPRPTFDVTAAFPDSNFSQTVQEAGEDLILDSQPNRETQAETQGVQIRFSQSQMHGFDTFLDAAANATQMSELIEPTQDSGFQDFSPLRQRFVEPPVSTVETMPAGQTQAEEQAESPLVRRTGKLRRKNAIVPASPTRRSVADEDDVVEGTAADEFGFGTTSNNAFAAMKEAAHKEKKLKEAFDKKKSKAREMIEEQAEESEDEYAGLGGADGEDSDDDDQSVKEMIDDETKDNEGDERKLAAFYA
jgi:mediator of replication checkpoint protein 1